MIRALSCVLILSATVVAQGGAKPADDAAKKREPVSVFWEPTLAAALERASRLGRPVMVAVHKPSVKASHEYFDSVYKSPLVRPLLRELVCTVASTEATAPLTEGPRKGKSVLFRTVTSEEAAAVALAVGERYLGDEIGKAPIHLFLNASGHLIQSKQGLLKQRDFIALVEKILDGQDPGWRPAFLEARGNGKDKSAPAAPFAALFGNDKYKIKKSIGELLDSQDKTIVAPLFAQIPSGDTKEMLLEAARRRPGDKSWMTKLLELGVEDKNPAVRAQAAVTAEAARIPALSDLLYEAHKKEKDIVARDELLRAMAATSRGEKRVWSAINQAVKDKRDEGRAMAYVALARFGDRDNSTASRAVDVLLKRGFKDRDSRARNAAVWAVAELRSKRAKREIEKMLKRTKKSLTRRFLEKAIRRIDGKEVEEWGESRRFVARESVRR